MSAFEAPHVVREGPAGPGDLGRAGGSIDNDRCVAEEGRVPVTHPNKLGRVPEEVSPARLGQPARSLRGGLAAVNKPLDWATLWKRVYSIESLACSCGGRLRFIAIVTEPEPVREILVAMGLDPTPPARAPPRQSDFGWCDPP